LGLLPHANGYDLNVSAEKRLMLCVLAREQILWGKQFSDLRAKA